MKKILFSFVLIAGITMLLSSCLSIFFNSTYKMVVDKDVPEEQSVTVTFETGSMVVAVIKEWNDKKIKDDLYGKKEVWSEDKTRLTVPAGNNSFIMDLTFAVSRGNTITSYPMKNIELKYYLEEGKKYKIIAVTRASTSPKGHEFFVGIYDVTKKSTLLKEWRLGGT
jgi:hypothetical protein